VNGAAQTVDPVYSSPPHCPNSGTVVPEGGGDEAGGDETGGGELPVVEVPAEKVEPMGPNLMLP